MHYRERRRLVRRWVYGKLALCDAREGAHTVSLEPAQVASTWLHRAVPTLRAA